MTMATAREWAKFNIRANCVINGQKIWTTLAAYADRIFVLARTDKTVKKQAGISFLLADMDTPGLTVRPIMNLAGEDELCEVFLDNVRVPAGNRWASSIRVGRSPRRCWLTSASRTVRRSCRASRSRCWRNWSKRSICSPTSVKRIAARNCSATLRTSLPCIRKWPSAVSFIVRSIPG